MANNPHNTNDPLTRDSMSFAENGIFYAMPWMNALFGEVFGANDQYRSQEWQDYMLTREQEWSDPAAQMERMKNAGINPNIAAQGIAGSPSSPSAPSSPSGSSAGAAGLGSIASMIGGIASGEEALQNAASINRFRDPTLKEILSRTHKNLTSSGVDEKTSQRMALENVFIPLEKQLGLHALQENINLQKEQIGWYRQSVDYIKAQIREIDEHIELMKSEGNLADKQALVASRQAKQIELQNFQLDFDNKLRALLKVNPNNPMAENIYIRALQGIDTSKDVQILEDINYSVASGQFNAEDNYAYSIAYRRKNGENAADVINGSVGGPVGFLNRLLNVGVATLNGAMAQFNKSADAAHNWIVGKIKDGKYNSVRNALQDQLEEFRRMENPPAEIQQAMLDLEQVLQLSNSELYDYFVKRK